MTKVFGNQKLYLFYALLPLIVTAACIVGFIVTALFEKILGAHYPIIFMGIFIILFVWLSVRNIKPFANLNPASFFKTIIFIYVAPAVIVLIIFRELLALGISSSGHPMGFWEPFLILNHINIFY